jgi:hypothetical protein
MGSCPGSGERTELGLSVGSILRGLAYKAEAATLEYADRQEIGAPFLQTEYLPPGKPIAVAQRLAGAYEPT